MNEFTKLELLVLQRAQKNLSKAFLSELQKESLLALENKIKFMIDNYCEDECQHEWDGLQITTTPKTLKCKKCNQVFYIVMRV